MPGGSSHPLGGRAAAWLSCAAKLARTIKVCSRISTPIGHSFGPLCGPSFVPSRASAALRASLGQALAASAFGVGVRPSIGGGPSPPPAAAAAAAPLGSRHISSAAAFALGSVGLASASAGCGLAAGVLGLACPRPWPCPFLDRGGSPSPPQGLRPWLRPQCGLALSPPSWGGWGGHGPPFYHPPPHSWGILDARHPGSLGSRIQRIQGSCCSEAAACSGMETRSTRRTRRSPSDPAAIAATVAYGNRFALPFRGVYSRILFLCLTDPGSRGILCLWVADTPPLTKA